MQVYWTLDQLKAHQGEPPGYAIAFNGTPLTYVLRADDETGEAEILCQDYRTGELIPDALNPYGYQTQKIKGELTITCTLTPANNDQNPEMSWQDLGNGYYGINFNYP